MQRSLILFLCTCFTIVLNLNATHASPHPEISIINGEKTVSYEKFEKNPEKYLAQGRQITPPWMVSLQMFTGVSIFGQKKFSHFCGGTLIGDRWIMTAAHCIKNNQREIGFISAQVGLTKISWGQDRYRVTKAFIHPDYVLRDLENDIALLQLQEPVQDAFYVNLPQCFNALNTIPHKTKMSAFGYGVTRYFSSNASNYLQHTHLKFQKDWEGAPLPYFTAGGTGHSDTAPGDSGGPLLYDTVQYGITSSGIPDLNMPSYYTNVAYYMPWIQSITGLTFSVDQQSLKASK